MKKISYLLIVLLLLISPLSARADAELDWNRSCRSKTGQTAVIYELKSVIVHSDGRQENVWQEIGTLPANTYVKVHTRSSPDGYIKISYYSGGEAVYAYVTRKPYPLVNACVYVDVVQTGFGIAVVEVNELYLEDLPALRAFIKKNYPDCRLLEEDERDDLEWGESDTLHLKDDADPPSGTDMPAGTDQPTATQRPSSTGQSSSKKTGSSSQKKTEEPLSLDISVKTEDGAAPVTVKKLGAYETIVRLNGKQLTVPTSDLLYEANVAPESALAVIYARNTGEVILRPQKETTGRVTKCKTGRVAIVIESDGEWSKLWYDGNVGFVQNKYLHFIPVADTATEGAIGRRTAPMHLQPYADTRVIKRLEAGTVLKILSKDEKWAEVSVNGWRGYVQLKYLK